MRTRTRTTTTIAAVAAAIASLGIAGTATAAHDDNPSTKVGSYTYGLAPVQSEAVARYWPRATIWQRTSRTASCCWCSTTSST